MSDRMHDTVRRWIDEAGTAMGGDARQRRDALLELETTIYDRVDERVQDGALPDEVVQDVLDAMGDPSEVGSSFVPQKPLLAPHQTRPFLINLTALFAVHFLVVIGATASGQTFAVPPVRIDPIADSGSMPQLLARALHTLLFDAGLLLCVFALVPRLGRLLPVRTVRPNARRCIETAFFLSLVIVVVNFYRSDLLALYVPTDIGTRHIPLVGSGIVDNLLWLNLWLGLAVGRELLYAWRGERKATLALDVVSNGIGVFCLLRIVATKTLVNLAPAHETLGAGADGLGGMLNTTLTLLALATAAILSAQLVRRAFRLALLRGA